MSSHKTIDWYIKDNYVKDRMIDNSLVHKFALSSKIQKRTKVFNAKIKKYCGIKDYKQYIKLKTNVIQDLIEDTDTDNSDNLSDTDYDIIYNSFIQNKNLVDDSERYIFAEEYIIIETLRKHDDDSNTNCYNKDTFKNDKINYKVNTDILCSKNNIPIRNKPRCKQNKQVSTKYSNVHLDIFHCRPYNIQQLIENKKLFVETIPASFTLADLSKDDEAFILNIPNKILQNNLLGQLLSLKEKTIKFGKNKYRIVHKKINSISCIFATSKQRRPYKIVNIKKISTITVRERLSHCSRKLDTLNSYDVISSETELSINNQTNKRNSKVLKDCNKRKRRSSDFETEHFATKKRQLKLIYS